MELGGTIMFDRIMRKLRDDDKERKIYEERAKRKNIHDNDKIPKMNENKKNEYNEKKQLKEGKKEKEDTLELRLSTFEIYEKMISQQIKKRLGELLPDKSRMKQSIVLMRQEFGGIFGEKEEGDYLYDEREEEEMNAKDMKEAAQMKQAPQSEQMNLEVLDWDLSDVTYKFGEENFLI